MLDRLLFCTDWVVGFLTILHNELICCFGKILKLNRKLNRVFPLVMVVMLLYVCRT
jgi:hypothetical protein